MTPGTTAQYSTGVEPADGTDPGVRWPNRIDVPTVLADLQAAVAERGDGFVYKAPDDEVDECVYIEEGPNGEAVPSCIVGHVLARHGLLTRPYATSNVALSGSYDELRSGFYEDFTPHAVQVLAKAQALQDLQELPWGDVLIAAKEVAASQDRDSDGT